MPMTASGGWCVILLLAKSANRMKASAPTCKAHWSSLKINPALLAQKKGLIFCIAIFITIYFHLIISFQVVSLYSLESSWNNMYMNIYFWLISIHLFLLVRIAFYTFLVLLLASGKDGTFLLWKILISHLHFLMPW